MTRARCFSVRAAVNPYILFNNVYELQLYLNLNTSGKIQAAEGLDGLLVGVEDIDQSLVGSALELLTAVLVLVNSAKDGNNFLLSGQGMGPETAAPLRFAVSTILAALASIK